MKVVDDAIEVLFDGAGGATLKALVNGLHYTESTERPETPYLRFDEVNAATDRTFGGKQGEMLVYQFTIFTDGQEATEVQAIWDAMTALYDDASLTVTGYNDMAMLRESHGKLVEAGEWKWWTRYNIWLEET